MEYYSKFTGLEVDELLQKVKDGDVGGSITVDTELSETSMNPLANATVTAELKKKVNAVEGKGLSSNDFTDYAKEKLDGLENYDDSALKADIAMKVSKTDLATINGQPLTNGGNIEVATNAYDDTEIKGKLTELEEKIDTKQDTLNAGQGISIDQDTKTISCTLDTTIFKVMDSLPTSPTSSDENKIYLVPSDYSESGNAYDEYLWVNNSWEKIGSFRPTVDLSKYADKSYVDSKVAALETKNTALESRIAELENIISQITTKE